MGRKCKCQVTGEIGTTDTFVKINGKYYKSQEIYDKYMTENNLRKKIINIIAKDFLNYATGQVFPTLLTKKIKELEFYPNEVILKTIENKYDDIIYWMNHKEFKNDVGKISYIFAIIKNSINDVYKNWKRNQEIKKEADKKVINIDMNMNLQEINTTQRGKDISQWLEGDEL